MKITLVCGLLGAGKTTFVQDMLRRPAQRTVVLVNDFGKVGIDGAVLEAEGIEAVELPSGCICCTLKSDLVETVKQVMEQFSPAHLVIEPSGMASPVGVLEALGSLRLWPITVVAVLDATEFSELYEEDIYGRFFTEQVQYADAVLVNKVDLAGEDAVEATIRLVETLNPAAVVFKTIRARIEDDLPEGRDRQLAGPSHHELNFDSHTFQPGGVIKYEAAARAFEALGDGGCGRVIRAKALLLTEKGPYRFDLSSGVIDAVPFTSELASNRVVVFGRELSEECLAEVLMIGDEGR